MPILPCVSAGRGDRNANDSELLLYDTKDAVGEQAHEMRERSPDDTLILWAGEVGRTPHSSGTDGRDRHISG